MMRRCYSR